MTSLLNLNELEVVLLLTVFTSVFVTLLFLSAAGAFTPVSE